MRLTDLQQAVRAADSGAVLVAPAVLDRVIRKEAKLPAYRWRVPHRRCYVVDRHVLFRYVDQEDLDLEPDRLLPPTVILLARPTAEKLGGESREEVLLQYWRRLFHARLHLAMERRLAEVPVSKAELRERVEEIGRAEFEEICRVLDRDGYLLPPGDERTVYVEFAAVYLELKYFARPLLPVYFPGIEDFEHIDRLLARDVDAESLFRQTRPAGAPDPVVANGPQFDESHDYYWRLVRSAEKAGQAGNTVRAAVLRTRAARVAPASLAGRTRQEARGDLQRLTARLQAALGLTDAEAAEWLQDLPALLEKADQGNRPVEAAVLYDLQKVGLDHEREIYALDVVEWLLSGGKRPVKRPLPGQRLVRVTRHLRSAAQRLTTARLSDEERQHLDRLLQTAVRQSEDRLRDRFRPVLADALLDVGLRPANPPERTAFAKMVEEMLDRISQVGFLTFGDLRDAISGNQLKLADLADPPEFVRGDPLLRLDRRLAAALDGVYRPSDFYQRWLERFTALNFGTATGRTISRFVTLPFGGALLIVEAFQKILDHTRWEGPVFGPLTLLIKRGRGEPALPEVGIPVFLLLGFFLFGLIHVPAVRSACRDTGLEIYRGLRALFVDLPAWVVGNPALRRLWRSWTFQLVWSYLLKPLFACAFLRLWVPEAFHTAVGAGTAFLAANFVLNSRLGRGAGEAAGRSVGDFFELLRAGLLPGLYRLILYVFKRITDAIESVLFTVDDWLRFRAGDTQWSMVARTVMGVFWYPLSFLARFYTVVLIEPGFNPIKAPASILAAKFIYPVLGPVLVGFLGGLLTPVLGPILANVFAAATVWLLPDAFGFLFWEMKENWSLYRANRYPALRPVPVGPHGETVRRLLYPGFHSGTVPRLYDRLRHAERDAAHTGNWRAARLTRQALEDVEKSFRRFVDRELVTLLEQAGCWDDHPVRVGRVLLACNRVRLELAHRDYPAVPVGLELEEHGGWLVAGVARPGWLDHLTTEQRQAVTTGLAGLYKLAGVHLVREQLRDHLPLADGYAVTARGLILWLDERHGQGVLYDLGEPAVLLRPRTLDGALPADGPVLDATKVVFARVPLSWQRWVESWQKFQSARETLKLLKTGIELLPVGK